MKTVEFVAPAKPILLGLLLGSLAAVSACGPSETSTTAEEAAAQSTVSTARPGESLGIASVPNLRDLGGYQSSAGETVARGLVYRSNQLSGISESDMEKRSPRSVSRSTMTCVPPKSGKSARTSCRPASSTFGWTCSPTRPRRGRRS